MDQTIIIPDAHAHVGSRAELAQRVRQQIPTILNIGTVEEAKMAEPFLNHGLLIPSYGIHPWRAAMEEEKEMKIIGSQYRVWGEVGMDSVWCDLSLSLQEEVLAGQLKLARDKNRPVVLHTKGCEKAVADMIAEYPNRYLVHWFSGESGLDAFLEQGCYISVGPDVWWNDSVRQAALRIPAHRILMETDGMEAVSWAYEESGQIPSKKAPGTVLESLLETLKETAILRGVEAEKLKEQVWLNFHRFIG